MTTGYSITQMSRVLIFFCFFSLADWVSRLHHVQRFRTQLEAKRRAANAEQSDVYDFTQTF